MALDRLDEYGSAWAVAQGLGPKLEVGPETLRKLVVQAQTDAGARPGPSSEELAEIKRLKRENADLREANEILKAGAVNFLREGTRPSPPLTARFVDEQRAAGHGSNRSAPSCVSRVCGSPHAFTGPGGRTRPRRGRSPTPKSWTSTGTRALQGLSASIGSVGNAHDAVAESFMACSRTKPSHPAHRFAPARCAPRPTSKQSP